MRCPKCDGEMRRFKLKDTGGFEKLRTVWHWVCIDCGFDKDYTDREL